MGFEDLVIFLEWWMEEGFVWGLGGFRKFVGIMDVCVEGLGWEIVVGV